MTASQPALTEEQARLLREAAAWRLIALLFECPRPGWHDVVAALGREVEDPRLQAAAEASQTEASEGLHYSLFGPGGPVSPREVTYLSGLQQGYLLAELGAYYEAFAYRPAAAEPSDHLSVEAGFMAYLTLKQAYALASADGAGAQVTAEAAGRFRTDHLAGMTEPIARALEAGGPSYLALAGQALFARVGPAPRQVLPMAGALADEESDGSCGAP
jgi:nitrate reductase assembly molybdenum cofactor insertion protein NarJ